ncbi:hypothetical protein WJX73_006432 [Symbiochloris irregularis]|uniref:Chalcone isomerase domain-containing protein n=1 Tax=Symbiochloris irregularis TaxID=706552 RepID=A0AAW1PBW0_9CHLO
MPAEEEQQQRPFRRKLHGLGKRVGNLGGGVVRRFRKRPCSSVAELAGPVQPSVGTSGREESRFDLLSSLRGFNPFPATQTASALSCFPARFCQQASIYPAQTCQELMAVGTRLWGPGAAQSLLRVKIYEFAIFMDGQQARQSKVKNKYANNTAKAVGDANFYRDLRSSKDIEMSLMVRASRNLPIKLLHAEYEKILKRRIQRVGGVVQDTALLQLLDCFREENIPPSIKEGDSVKKGTLLVFRKEGNGRLRARANDHELADVSSTKLCQAVFDLYLGDQPVSRKAKRIAGESFFKLDAGQQYEPPQDALVCPVVVGNACMAVA